jgi:glucose-1-phosphate cytidylyltransferase
MKIYEAYGHRDFVLCLGHLQEQFHAYFEGATPADWDVALADTGRDTPTGGRILRMADRIGSDFFATYGDGVADVDLDRLLAFHRSHGRVATVTIVRPRGNFGIARVDDDGRVLGFEEKPIMEDWVNGGFFVFRPEIFDYLSEDSVLERDPFESLVAEGEIMAYRHTGFWSCMDTYKDNLLLNEIWSSGQAPWRIWE